MGVNMKGTQMAHEIGQSFKAKVVEMSKEELAKAEAEAKIMEEQIKKTGAAVADGIEQRDAGAVVDALTPAVEMAASAYISEPRGVAAFI